MAKMKLEAQLAAKGAHCGNISSGTYLPPKDQLPEHKNEPYMITCKANDSNNYYNVYFADSDLKAAQAKDRMEAVSPEYARSTCVKVLEKKFPTANLDTSNTRYDASKVTSNVL